MSKEEFTIPTATKYAAALQNISITENQKKMLEFHYLAHNRTVTFSELASVAGFDNYRSANLQYGTLGKTLGEELNMKFLTFGNGEMFYSSAIGIDNPAKPKGTEYQLVMHHELAKAFDSLGWFA